MLLKSHSGMNYACMAFLLTDAIPLCRDSHITLFRANHNRVKGVLVFMAYILSQLGKSHIFILSVLFGMCALFVQLGASEGNAATYYVSTSGNDANPGTSDRPWRNLQKCAASPIRAGDTCIVRSGTYAAPSGKYVTINIGGSAPSGTSSQPITIKSEKTNGAVVIVPSTSYSLNAAFMCPGPTISSKDSTSLEAPIMEVRWGLLESLGHQVQRASTSDQTSYTTLPGLSALILHMETTGYIWTAQPTC